MKKLVIIISLLMVNMTFGLTVNNFVETSDTQGGSSKITAGYNYVTVDCDLTACFLSCYGAGTTPCGWHDADYICDCNFNNSVSQEMFDYAHEKMDSSIFVGTHTSNILPVSGIKYYRTVSWVQDSIGTRVIQYTLGED